MYDPKQNLNIFSRNMYIFLKYCGLQREKDIRKEKQILIYSVMKNKHHLRYGIHLYNTASPPTALHLKILLSFMSTSVTPIYILFLF